jgi:hypothetical protein
MRLPVVLANNLVAPGFIHGYETFRWRGCVQGHGDAFVLERMVKRGLVKRPAETPTFEHRRDRELGD